MRLTARFVRANYKDSSVPSLRHFKHNATIVDVFAAGPFITAMGHQNSVQIQYGQEFSSMTYCVMKFSEVLVREDNKLMSYKLLFRPRLRQTPVKQLGTLPAAASSVGEKACFSDPTVVDTIDTSSTD
jgi:hypothetical protein